MPKIKQYQAFCRFNHRKLRLGNEKSTRNVKVLVPPLRRLLLAVPLRQATFMRAQLLDGPLCLNVIPKVNGRSGRPKQR
jgi:hypothetical protein